MGRQEVEGKGEGKKVKRLELKVVKQIRISDLRNFDKLQRGAE